MTNDHLRVGLYGRVSGDQQEKEDTIASQLIAQKAQQTLKELHDAAKIEIVDPEIKKSMEAAAKDQTLPDQSGAVSPETSKDSN